MGNSCLVVVCCWCVLISVLEILGETGIFFNWLRLYKHFIENFNEMLVANVNNEVIELLLGKAAYYLQELSHCVQIYFLIVCTN